MKIESRFNRLQGIPYFGYNTNKTWNDLTDKVKNTNTDNIEEKSICLDNFIEEYLNEDLLILIPDENGNYLRENDKILISWINDIKCDYKHKECYILYFDYDMTLVDIGNRQDYSGHLRLVDDCTSWIRYNLRLEKYQIVKGMSILCVNLENLELIKFSIDNYTNREEIDIDELTKRYLFSSFTDESKHSGGYSIFFNVKHLYNPELRLIKKYELDAFIDKESECGYDDYRDVREYTKDYIESKYKVTLNDNGVTYRDRRVMFECMLYCCIMQGLKFNVKWEKFTQIYKVETDTVPFIIKRYWECNDSYDRIRQRFTYKR